MLREKDDFVGCTNAGGLIADFVGEDIMMTIDRIDTPNSPLAQPNMEDDRSLSLDALEQMEQTSANQRAFQQQQNANNLQNAASSGTHWLSRAWRLLTNSIERNIDRG